MNITPPQKRSLEKSNKISKTKFTPQKNEKSDIYSVVNIFSLYFKFTGLATISRSNLKKGKYLYITEKLTIINVTFLVLRTSIAIYFLYETFLDIYLKREMITKVLYVFTCISSLITLISTAYYTPSLIETLNKIDEIDKTLNMPSYNTWMIISGMVLTMHSAIVIIFYTIKFLHEETMEIVTEYFSFAQSFIILTLMLIVFNMFVLILRERFQRINHMIKEFDNTITFYVKPNSRKNEKKQSQRDFLNNMTELHYALCECASTINDTYSVALFFCVHIVYGEIILAAYTVKYPYETILNDVHFILFGFIFTMQLIFVLISTHLTEKESNTTFILLGDLTVCYYDDNMAVTRNSLLLQGLHHKVEFNMLQIYPLNLGVLVEELSTITTIVLFLID